MKELVLRNPRDSINEGLYDRGLWMRDARVGKGHNGLILFRAAYSQRNPCAPLNNIWQFDIGKLVFL